MFVDFLYTKDVAYLPRNNFYIESRIKYSQRIYFMVSISSIKIATYKPVQQLNSQEYDLPKTVATLLLPHSSH